MHLRQIDPRPVRLPLAGRRRRVLQLRVRHLAALAERAALAHGDPLHRLDPAEASHHAAIRREYDREAEAGGLDWGSPACDRWVFGTKAGRAAFLRLALRREPGVTRPVALALADALTPAEWSAVDRVAFAVEPMAAWQEMADVAAGVRWMSRGGLGPSYGRLVYAAARAGRTTPDVILGLYLAQFRLLLSRGRPLAPIDASDYPKGATAAEVEAADAARERFWADDPSVGGPPPPQPAGDEADRPAREQ